MRDELRQFEDISFIGGSDQKITFNITDDEGEPLDLEGCTIKWFLSYVGEKSDPIVVKDNDKIGGIDIVGKGIFSLRILSTDTENLDSNRYEQEPVIIQSNGKVIKPSYGFITIRKGSHY